MVRSPTGKGLKRWLALDCVGRTLLSAAFDLDFCIKDCSTIVRTTGYDPWILQNQEINTQGGGQACPERSR